MIYDRSEAWHSRQRTSLQSQRPRVRVPVEPKNCIRSLVSRKAIANHRENLAKNIALI